MHEFNSAMGDEDASRAAGLSMLEALIALMVLVWASIAALSVYGAMWSTFKRGENAADQQQTVRIAFDKLVLDVQVSGYNHNPDGSDARPDEPIEAAFDTAIVIRADFDEQNPATRGTPESGLAGGAFESVTVGNDEIVTYVLAKPDGSSTDTLTFNADVANAQRDGVTESISIPNVALVQDDPPYTLYRISLNNDPSTWGTSDFIVREPLAENVRTLTFRYFNSKGDQINSTFDLTSTSEDIGGADTAPANVQRLGVRRIEIDLVGLTRDPDMNWVDQSDPNPATQSYRKFQLGANVTRRNSGMEGVPDLPAS